MAVVTKKLYLSYTLGGRLSYSLINLIFSNDLCRGNWHYGDETCWEELIKDVSIWMSIM